MKYETVWVKSPNRKPLVYNTGVRLPDGEFAWVAINEKQAAAGESVPAPLSKTVGQLLADGALVPGEAPAPKKPGPKPKVKAKAD